MVLVQQFSIFPCIKQWNEWFYFAFIFNGVWIAFRETCNTPFQNNTLPKLQSRKSHSNVLTFLTVRLLIFRCVIISYTHLYTCHGCVRICWLVASRFFHFIFNVIEIYSVCLSSESFFCSIAYIVCSLYIHQIIFSSCLPFIHSFIQCLVFFRFTRDGLQKLEWIIWLHLTAAYNKRDTLQQERHIHTYKKRDIQIYKHTLQTRGRTASALDSSLSLF